MSGDHSCGAIHKKHSMQHLTSLRRQVLGTADMPGCVHPSIVYLSLYSHPNGLAQYEVFDASQPTPYISKTYDGCLQKIISVTFTNGYEDVHLNEGMALVVALFHPCVLMRNNPRMDRLGIHPYSQEDEHTLHVTDITCVYGLVGRVKDGPSSWAIIDHSNRVPRVAYLTHEESNESG